MRKVLFSILPVVGLLLTITACTNGDSSSEQLPDLKKTGAIDVGQVAIRVKQEVGFYISSQPETEADWRKVFIASGLYTEDGKQPPGGTCGNSRIALDIKKVQLDLLASYDTINGVSGGLKIPLGPPDLAADVKPGGAYSKESIGSVEFKHTYYSPEHTTDSSDWRFLQENPSSAIFKSALESVRNGLIAASGHKPCFGNYADQKNPDPETATFSIAVKTSTKKELGFDIFIINVDASSVALLGRTNTITVTYVPRKT